MHRSFAHSTVPKSCFWAFAAFERSMHAKKNQKTLAGSGRMDDLHVPDEMFAATGTGHGGDLTETTEEEKKPFDDARSTTSQPTDRSKKQHEHFRIIMFATIQKRIALFFCWRKPVLSSPKNERPIWPILDILTDLTVNFFLLAFAAKHERGR